MSVPAQRLGLSEAVGLSLSMMAPTMAMAINVSLAVRAEGRAAPMAFAIGTFLLTIIALSFVSFGRRVAHAGSVYAYIGEACGRRLGFIAGWTLLLTYLSYASGCSALIGNFVGVAAQNYGAKNPTIWLAVGLCGLLIATVLAFRDMRVAGRFMLALEAVSVLAIVLLCLVVLANVARTSGLCPAPFRPRRKQRLVRHRICNCLQYPFLRWFRRRCDLGRRATEPLRNIPVDILDTCALAAALRHRGLHRSGGFWTGATKDLAAATAPLDDLAIRYFSKNFARLISRLPSADLRVRWGR